MAHRPLRHAAFFFMHGSAKHCTLFPPAHFGVAASLRTALHEHELHISVTILQSVSTAQTEPPMPTFVPVLGEGFVVEPAVPTFTPVDADGAVDDPAPVTCVEGGTGCAGVAGVAATGGGIGAAGVAATGGGGAGAGAISAGGGGIVAVGDAGSVRFTVHASDPSMSDGARRMASRGKLMPRSIVAYRRAVGH